MSEDLKQGRETEIDYLQGFVIELARDAGTPVPYCEGVYYCIKQCENSKEKHTYDPQQIIDYTL